MAASRSLTSLIQSVFHFAVFSTYVVALLWHEKYISGRVPYGFAGRWKYLTFINELLQTVYFAVALLNDVFGSNCHPGQDRTKRCGLQKVRDIILTSLAFPMGLFVVVTFWGLWAIDRELVFPKALDAIFPAWLNHIMHTTVIVFLLIEKFVIYHPYPRRAKGLAFCLTFASIYQIWIFWIAYHADLWVYPVLAVLSWPARFGFLAGCWTLVFIFYMTGEFITNSLWSVPARVKGKQY